MYFFVLSTVLRHPPT